MTIFEAAADPLRDELRTVDVDALRPLEALNLIAEWKRRYEGGSRARTEGEKGRSE
jgi:hypothetical protein